LARLWSATLPLMKNPGFGNEDRLVLVVLGLFVFVFRELIHVKDTHDKFDTMGTVIVAILLIAVALLLPREK